MSVLAKASRIKPETIRQKIEDGYCFQDMESMKIQEATLGMIQAQEMPDGITYEQINKKLKDINLKHFVKAEFCQCKKFKDNK